MVKNDISLGRSSEKNARFFKCTAKERTRAPMSRIGPTSQTSNFPIVFNKVFGLI